MASRGRQSRRHHAVVHEEEGGSERWLVTYADMLTLLLVLFIVLFSISVVNTSKFESLKQSLAAAFGMGPGQILSGGTGLTDSGANDGKQVVVSQDVAGGVTAANADVAPAVPVLKPDYSSAVAQELNNFAAIKKAINKALAAKGMEGDVSFKIDHRGMVITVVTTGLLFGGNSADLLPQGRELLNVVGPPLKNYPNRIEVDGYTNQEKVSTYPFVSGWDLSATRAGMVAHSVEESGVARDRLTAVGLSDQNPLYPPSDPRASKYNRRVEIVVLSTLPDDARGALDAAGAAG